MDNALRSAIYAWFNQRNARCIFAAIGKMSQRSATQVLYASILTDATPSQATCQGPRRRCNTVLMILKIVFCEKLILLTERAAWRLH
jgi:hypothetical protein